jgi:phosphate starvation-inducible PhoH-like protein
MKGDRLEKVCTFLTDTLTLEFDNPRLLPLLFGEHNTHIAHLEDKLGIVIADRGNQLTMRGEKKRLQAAEAALDSLWEQLENAQEVGIAEIDAALRFAQAPVKDTIKTKHNDKILIKTRKKSIAPRSPNQAHYIQAIQDHHMVFGLGPAGTGKTYLAVAAGVSLYLSGTVERLIFTRPAIEAGENLGFLPGDMREKVDPYLRPIYDALHDMLPMDFLMKKMEAGDIEIAPLAFMRGRTLQNAFVILDEAQNTTCMQMKMFLTRMGESSRMVITGDLTQTDLPKGQKSGLRDATELLKSVKEIAFIHFANKDVIRHPLVTRIVQAYDHQKD